MVYNDAQIETPHQPELTGGGLGALDAALDEPVEPPPDADSSATGLVGLTASTTPNEPEPEPRPAVPGLPSSSTHRTDLDGELSLVCGLLCSALMLSTL